MSSPASSWKITLRVDPKLFLVPPTSFLGFGMHHPASWHPGRNFWNLQEASSRAPGLDQTGFWLNRDSPTGSPSESSESSISELAWIYDPVSERVTPAGSTESPSPPSKLDPVPSRYCLRVSLTRYLPKAGDNTCPFFLVKLAY